MIILTRAAFIRCPARRGPSVNTEKKSERLARAWFHVDKKAICKWVQSGAHRCRKNMSIVRGGLERQTPCRGSEGLKRASEMDGRQTVRRRQILLLVLKLLIISISYTFLRCITTCRQLPAYIQRSTKAAWYCAQCAGEHSCPSLLQIQAAAAALTPISRKRNLISSPGVLTSICTYKLVFLI
ncbi:hypothetical protein F5880DRAFT_394246 [Lentinula raphanica]|nr:hypothetical protein F5880DRAFT_394246 [Lentinula raphanica]